MGIREKMSQKPAIGVGIGIAFLALAVTGLAFQARDATVKAPTKALFTTDDGKTWFVGSIDDIPPFDHDGKQAVRAFVFECGGKESVYYVQRYTEPARKRILAAQGKGPSELAGALQAAALSGGLETKRPGDQKWVGVTKREALAITTVKCPDGSPAISIDP